MRTRQLINVLLAVACLAIAVTVMGVDRPQPLVVRDSADPSSDLRYVELPNGERGLMDATDHVVPLRRYSRIVGASIVARSALAELSEPGRVVAVHEAGADDSPSAFRFAGVARLSGIKDTERVLSLDPDLLIINSVGSQAHLQRLRDAGLEVFVLGDMRGVDTFVRDLRQVAVLLGVRARGERLATRFRRRMAAVAADIPHGERQSGMYVSVYGAQLFGGTVGTSFHDVLTFAGLDDAAAARFRAWPQYTAEHVLSVDPEIIVVPAGVGATLCNMSALQRLQACQHAGIVEVPASWLEDPSMVMLEVAETIREAVYGPP
jgi:iron complex transport system substrate-binding protein